MKDPPHLVYYICHGPNRVSLSGLARIAGARWRSAKPSKSPTVNLGWTTTKCGSTPDGTGTSPSPVRPSLPDRDPLHKRGTAAGEGELIRLSLPEIRRLLVRFVWHRTTSRSTSSNTQPGDRNTNTAPGTAITRLVTRLPKRDCSTSWRPSRHGGAPGHLADAGVLAGMKAGGIDRETVG